MESIVRRRLVETEAEQQRLADAEEFEKADELSAEITRLKSESESAAQRLRLVNRRSASNHCEAFSVD